MILTIHDSTGTGGGGSERRRYLQIGLLALALLLVAVLGFRQVQRWISPEQEVWVASADLGPGTTLGSHNLKKAKVATSSLPRGAVVDARALSGRELSRPKQEGAPFVREDFANGSTSTVAVAEMVPEGRVLTTIRVPKGLVPYKNLKNGDRVDLISIAGRSGGGYARVVASDAYLVGMIFSQQAAQNRNGGRRNSLADLVASSSPRPKTDPTLGLVLAVHPEDALPLAQAYGGRNRLQVVLHGSAEVASGQLLELPEREAAGVELIAGNKSQRLKVTP
jgi:Flp pilus assembly protein CpaB